VKSDAPKLPIADLAERHVGLTPALAESYGEAARVCLDRHHRPPVPFSIQSDGVVIAAVIDWQPADDRCRAAYANEIDATEWGAYACALASTELTRGLVAISRAQTLTGADYYLGKPGTSLEDLEECVRLEVSGTDKGSDRDVEVRLLEKVSQARRGQSNLPALAGVVGFKAQKIAIQEVGTLP
jgi:hypothetical protein